MSKLQQELRQSRAFTSPRQEAFLNLVRTVGQVSGPFARLFKEHGLSLPAYNVLRILRGQDGEGLACSQIGERMVSRDPDITRLVDRLVRSDLARRERSATDRRMVLITITAAGLALLAELEAPVVALHDEVLGHLSDRELKELNRLLVKARTCP